MPFLFNLLVRIVLLAAGLVFAVVLAGFFLLVLALWLLAAGWALLTGRRVSPFVVRMGPRRGFEEMMRRARPQPASRTPRSDAAAGVRPRLGDVTDVEPK
jgi:hypothetical protein